MATTARNQIRAFLEAAGWGDAAAEPLSGDASGRRYFRLRRGGQTAVLMECADDFGSVAPFIRIDRHLEQLGFSVPAIVAENPAAGLLLLEDFGDETFGRLLDQGRAAAELYALATDVLIALHRHPAAVPAGLRTCSPDAMLADVELFLEWRAPAISEAGREEFRAAWSEVLPMAHEVPASLLLRDYHVANLMHLPDRPGIRRTGLLDFQDAYQGPVTYDLVSLLEDARRDVPEEVREKMTARYLAGFPDLDRQKFEVSLAVLAALRHTRVLAIFERLSRRDRKSDYRQKHSPRVERLLQKAMAHPRLARLKRWMERYAR